MKTVSISQGRVALVSDEDHELVMAHKWYLRTSKSGGEYAQASVYSPATKKQKTISMHRLILGLSDPDVKGDHKDGNGLNNQRENIRPSTTRLNRRAFVRKVKGTSLFRGVSWDKPVKKWRAKIAQQENGKTRDYYLGVFDTEKEAALAYNQKATELGFLPEALNRVA